MIDVDLAAAGAAALLRQAQHADGHWEDFQLPVGRSDAWVTAYVGLAMSDWAAIDDGSEPRASARAAAGWLREQRSFAPGWGYNGTAGADADSTAHALLLLRRHGPVLADDVAWLRERWLPHAGFATYARSDAWGIAHPCVTPMAYLALDEADRRALGPEVLRCISTACEEAGTWPAYWWRTSHYSTFVNLLALTHLGATVEPLAPVAAPTGALAIVSAFDLACLTGIATLRLGWCRATLELAALTCAQRRADGTWPPGAGLRVTEPDCHAPWAEPRGSVFEDEDGILTAATVLRVLALLLTKR